MKCFVRMVFVLTVCCVTAAFAGGGQEVENEDAVFPSKPVHIIVGYNPGGGTDVPARALATSAPEFLNDQPLIISNKTGSNGMIASKFVATQPPDGYTLLMGWGNTEFTFLRHQQELPIKTFDDFTPVMAVIKYTSLMAVPVSSSIYSLDDLVTEAKKNPGKLKWTHTGAGGEHYVNGIDFIDRAGIEMTEVPSSGGVATRNLVASENVDVGVFASFLAAGMNDKIRIIAVFSEDKESLFPDAPTAIEQGYESVNAYAIKCIAAPAGTPKERVQDLYERLHKAFEHPAAQKILLQNSFTPLGWGPEQTLDAVKQLDEKYKAVIDRLGL